MSKTTDFSKVDKLVDKLMQDGLNDLGKAIKNRATVLAPKDTGALRQSGKVEVATDDKVIVSFGNSKVRYARRREWENYLHPSTKHYLKNGLKSIKDASRYFKRTF